MSDDLRMIMHIWQALLGVPYAIGLLLVTLAGPLTAAEDATPGTHALTVVTAEVL